MIAKNKFLGVAVYFVLLYVSVFKAIAQQGPIGPQPLLNEAQRAYIISFIVDHQLMYGQGGLTNLLRCQDQLTEETTIYLMQDDKTEEWFKRTFFLYYPEYLKTGDTSAQFQDLISCDDFPPISSQLPVECTTDDFQKINEKLVDRVQNQKYALALKISDIVYYQEEYYVHINAYRSIKEGLKVFPAGGVYRIQRFASGLIQFKEYYEGITRVIHNGDESMVKEKYEFEVVFPCD